VSDPPQYGWWSVLAIWAAATLPMGLAAWVVAPAFADASRGALLLLQPLVLALTAGLLWQVVIVAFLVRRETGTWAWSSVRRALWLVRPQSPRTGRVGGRVWLMLLPAVGV